MTEQNLVAWRCEECHEWHSVAEEVNEILVLEIGPDAGTLNHVERAYISRLLRVCSDCLIKITGEPKLGFGS